MKITKKLALACAVALTLTFAVGCSSDKKSSSSAADSSDSAESSTDSKIDLYLDDNGNAYYYNADGEKMIVSAYADESTDDTESNIYDNYDVDGLKFDIPDGWYVNSSFGAPSVFEDTGDDSDPNYDEYITLMPTAQIFDSDSTEMTKDVLDEYFAELVDAGYYTEYKFTDSGDTDVNGVTAKYFDMTITYSLGDDDDSTVSFRGRYIFTDGDNSYCIMITSLDDDDSFKKIEDIYEQIAPTMTLPTAEEIAASTESEDDSAEEISLDDLDIDLDDLDIVEEDESADEETEDSADEEAEDSADEADDASEAADSAEE